jgi:hypothetical protein
MVVHLYHLALGRLSQKDGKFETSLDYTVSSMLAWDT